MLDETEDVCKDDHAVSQLESKPLSEKSRSRTIEQCCDALQSLILYQLNIMHGFNSGHAMTLKAQSEDYDGWNERVVSYGFVSSSALTILLRSNHIAGNKFIAVMVGLVSAWPLYLFIQWLSGAKKLHKLVLRHMSSLLLEMDSYCNQLQGMILAIQEVELVARGYRLNALTVPVARIEYTATHRFALRSRECIADCCIMEQELLTQLIPEKTLLRNGGKNSGRSDDLSLAGLKKCIRETASLRILLFEHWLDATAALTCDSTDLLDQMKVYTAFLANAKSKCLHIEKQRLDPEAILSSPWIHMTDIKQQKWKFNYLIREMIAKLTHIESKLENGGDEHDLVFQLDKEVEQFVFDYRNVVKTATQEESEELESSTLAKDDPENDVSLQPSQQLSQIQYIVASEPDVLLADEETFEWLDISSDLQTDSVTQSALTRQERIAKQKEARKDEVNTFIIHLIEF